MQDPGDLTDHHHPGPMPRQREQQRARVETDRVVTRHGAAVVVRGVMVHAGCHAAPGQLGEAPDRVVQPHQGRFPIRARRFAGHGTSGGHQGMVTLWMSTGADDGFSSSAWETPFGVMTSIAFGTASGLTEQMGLPAAMASAVHTPNW